jgi:hypothetical protein
MEDCGRVFRAPEGFHLEVASFGPVGLQNGGVKLVPSGASTRVIEFLDGGETTIRVRA